MDIGTGIFFSALFIGSVLLFSTTKDRWNWRKIILVSIGSLVGISVLVGGGLYAISAYENRAVKQTELWGITLGLNKSEVRFIKGEPLDGSTETDWAYHTGDAKDFYLVAFKEDKVVSIMYFGKAQNGPTIVNLSQYNHFNDLVDKFGTPTFVSESADKTSRWYSFAEYNVTAVLEQKNTWVGFGIYDSRNGPMKYKN